MVLPFVLQRLLQVQTVGQEALSQVVAELRDTEQVLLHTHRVAAHKQQYTQETTFEKNAKLYLKCFRLYFNACRGIACFHVIVMTQMNTNITD